jgi:hypothetical protein
MSDMPAVFIILIFVLAFGVVVTVFKTLLKRNSTASAGVRTVANSPSALAPETVQLKQLSELHASGILSDEEFAAKKAAILKRI